MNDGYVFSRYSRPFKEFSPRKLRDADHFGAFSIEPTKHPVVVSNMEARVKVQVGQIVHCNDRGYSANCRRHESRAPENSFPSTSSRQCTRYCKRRIRAAYGSFNIEIHYFDRGRDSTQYFSHYNSYARLVRPP